MYLEVDYTMYLEVYYTVQISTLRVGPIHDITIFEEVKTSNIQKM